MIVVKAPLRVSFFGGGSDLPQYYNKKPGMCLSTSINKYIYLAVNKCVANHIRVVYSEFEYTDSINNIRHDRVRETLKHFSLTNNIEISSFSDVPTKGTGLGSSSTFTVAMAQAASYLSAPLKNKITRADLAELACDIEINKCREPIGKQDQYAATYGGLNQYHFHSQGEVFVQPVSHNNHAYGLQNNLMCFASGNTRYASTILHKQTEDLNSDKNDVIGKTAQMVDMAFQGSKYLSCGKLDDFGQLLHEAWMVKKTINSGISNDNIDCMYETALKAGALGGKLLGAGGGGYLLLYVPTKYQRNVTDAMTDFNKFPFAFETKGSTLKVI
jgi:D-glycero-alpha-D-manno-heptose-7-phosphate kinase